MDGLARQDIEKIYYPYQISVGLVYTSNYICKYIYNDII